MGGVGLVDQCVITILPVRFERWLGPWSGEQWGHHWSIGVVLIHRRNVQQGFDGVNQVDRGVEARIYKRLFQRSRRIFADHIRGRAVSIYVIGAVLSVIFQHENRGVIPVRAVGNRFNYTAYRQIIVGDRSSGARGSGFGTVGVIVGQVKQNKLWQLSSLAFLASADESFKFI